MVTFHRVPYALARSRGETQDRVLTELCDSIHSVAEIDWSKADALVQRELTPLETA
jgi:kynurenine 3-monooxygenase